MSSACTLCGDDGDLDEHHTSYEPEETVMLCRSCHQTVHKADSHELQPDDSSSKTTIEVAERVRDALREERLPHENTYGDTLARLLDDDTGGQLWTEAEIRDLCREEIRSARR
jgi:hypothetical protein